MKKAWRVIIVIVLVAILLGAVCLGVGLMTGGDLPRIYSALDSRYHLEMYYNYGVEVFEMIADAFRPAP